MEHRLDRRAFVRRAAAGALSLALPSRPRRARRTGEALAAFAEFPHGVASGEPAPRAITLWTHAGRGGGGGRLGLEVARDPGFARVVHSSTVALDPRGGGAVGVRLSGAFLAPGEEGWYRFFARDGSSPVGRFRTARPTGSREPVRIGVFSCQELGAGFYNAHADLAAHDDLDLVVCLGDYVYERAFAGPSRPVREDDSAPDGEAQTLAEYRRKYALYHSDPDLRAVRARHPLVAVWDDHEVEDNYAARRPGGAAGERRVPFAQRRRNGYRAFLEHMPRVPRGDRIYGRLGLGGADLLLLDTRQYRDDQPCNPADSALSPPCPPSATGRRGRTLLGARQRAWLAAALARSPAPWKLVANQVMAMSLDASPGRPLNTDAWDGYAAERERVLDAVAARRGGEVAFLTGDVHSFFAGTVSRSGRGGAALATEFVAGAVTSPGVVDRLARSERERVVAAAGVDALVRRNNPHIAYANQAYKGYALVEARPDELLVRLRAVRETRVRPSPSFTLRTLRVERGEPEVQDLGR